MDLYNHDFMHMYNKLHFTKFKLFDCNKYNYVKNIQYVIR